MSKGAPLCIHDRHFPAVFCFTLSCSVYIKQEVIQIGTPGLLGNLIPSREGKTEQENQQQIKVLQEALVVYAANKFTFEFCRHFV